MKTTDLEFNAADDADRSSAIEEFFLRQAQRFRKPEGPVATGWCLNCEKETPEGRRWCDTDCRDDWERLGGGSNL